MCSVQTWNQKMLCRSLIEVYYLLTVQDSIEQIARESRSLADVSIPCLVACRLKSRQYDRIVFFARRHPSSEE